MLRNLFKVFLVVSVFLFLLCGCSAKLPNEEQIIADLAGAKTGESIIDRVRTIKSVNSLEILGTQDNLKNDNTVKFLVQADWIEGDSVELNFSGELEITYEDFGDDLFKIQAIAVDEDSLKLIPPSVPNEEALKTLLMSTELVLAENEDDKFLNGEVEGISQVYSVELDYEKNRTISISDYSFNESDNEITFTMDATAETEHFSFLAQYRGTASYSRSSAPDWTINIQVINQSVSYNYPEKIEGELDTGTLTDKFVDIDFIKDDFDKITGATVNIVYQPILSKSDNGVYEVTASFDPITNELVLLAGDWIQRPTNEIFEKFDIAVWYSDWTREYYIDPVNYEDN